MNSLDEAYEASLREINLVRVRVGAVMAGALIMVFTLLDFFSYPDYAKTFLFLRIVCTAFLLLAWGLSYTKFGLPNAKALGMFEMSIIGIMINIMIRCVGYETPYYAGLNLVILAIGVLYPWGLKETLLTSVFIYGCYLLPILLLDSLSNVITFANNNIFLLATIIIACTASFFSSALRRREFSSRYQLEEANTKLQEMDRLKSHFFANISHELRTPLTLLIGPAEMMLKRELGALTENQEKYVRVIHTHSIRLLKLINNLLDLSKTDAQETQLYLQRGNFREFLQKTVYSILPLALKKAIKVSFEVDETVPEFLYDPEKMEDVILNLFSNALKFTEKGEIHVSCAMQSEHVLVKISDTGIGIPLEAIPKLFDRFFQVDTAASRVGAGTGIGLSIVKEWIALHQGRVWVESVEGQGSIFSFVIPVRRGEGVDLPKGTQKPTLALPEPSLSLLEAQVGLQGVGEADPWEKVVFREGVETILLVDDNIDMLHFMSDQLRSDYNLLFARDGEEGVRIAQREHPDLVISDIMMPGKNGYQLCRELKGGSQTATIPFIFLTARGGLSNKIEGLEQGADDYLAKPFNREELKARAQSLLRQRALQKEVSVKNKELEESLTKLKGAERDLIHSEKMAALGVLMTGIAHEINNPVSFARGSLSVAQKALEEIKGVPLQDIKEALDTVNSGLDRVGKIVQNLSIFIRTNDTWVLSNFHADLDAILRLVDHELRGRIEVERRYGSLPLVEVLQGQINQVFMNILRNAVQAIRGRGKISITTEAVGATVRISIRDTGEGISETHLPKIFDPFFTTKDVGKGLGLGMSISNKIINSHHGKLNVHSRVGEGTEFVITLPQKQPSHKE
jgi:signal transduction histidine kinase